MKIYNIIEGKKKELETVNDDVFSQKMLGDGIAITPKNGRVVAPEQGEITMIFPTNHAISLKTESGVEVLIHIGIDTVEMNGNGFKAFVEQGQIVKRGDTLIEFDLNKVIEAGYETDVMVIITNNSKYKEIKKTSLEDLDLNNILLEIE